MAKLKLLSVLARMLGVRRVYLLRFLLHHRRWPRLSAPERITDKIAGRILSGRSDERRLRLTDKLRAREVVAERCPGLRVKRVFAVYASAAELRLEALPERFVLKPSNASGMNLLVYDKRTVSERALRRRIAPWFRLSYYYASQEPSYRGLEPRVLAEELLSTPDGLPPGELQAYCFHGRAAFLEFHHQDPANIDDLFFDREWNHLPVQYPGPPSLPRMARPGRLEEAVLAAEAIAAGLDFLRVDLYLMADGSLVFSEVAHSPWGGLFRLEPEAGDVLLGSFWQPYQADEAVS